MKKKRLIAMIAQFLLIGTFGFAFINYVQKETQPTDVWTFKGDIPVNTEISLTDLQPAQIPAKAVTDGFMKNPDDIVGKYTTTNVSKNQYVLNDFVQTKDNVDPFKSMDMSDLRKITLPVTNVDALAGNLKKGDKVDLVFTGNGKKNSDDFQYSKVFVQGVYVWGVNTDEGYLAEDHSQIKKVQVDTEAGDNKEKISTDGADTSKPTSVTLAVTLDQAEEISSRMKSGTVKIVGRFEESKDYNSLGFVLGDYSKVFSGSANAETSSNVIN